MDRRTVAVRGVGTTSFGRFPERRIEELAWEAALEALDDAGTEPAAVEAVFVGTVFGPPGVAVRILRGLGIGEVPVLTLENACASGTTAYHEAVEAVALGRYTTTLVVGVEQLSTVFDGPIVPETTDAEGRAGLALPALYALSAQRYLACHGATVEQLAAVAVKNKANGTRNPRAQLRTAPSLDDVLSSRMIADPLTLLQCCPLGDGAGAAVVGRPRGAESEVEVLSSALVSGALWDHRSDDLWGEACVARAARQAFAAAEVTPADVSVAEVHDAFTIGEVTTLEALGFCGRGEGAELAPAGYTAVGGEHPVNTSGGLLARGHPLGATGLAQLAEVVWQLRGEARGRQVAGAEVGLVETMGGGAAGVDGNACVVTLLAG